MDKRNLDVLGLDAELGLGMFGQEARKGLAILIGVDLRAEDVLQVLVLEHGGRNRGGDPEDLLLLFDLRRQRDRVRARINAVDDVDLLLVDQSDGLVDRNVRLALGIGVDGDDLVLAADAALLIDEIDRDLRADRGSDRAARRERTGQIVDHADAHRFGLRLRACPIEVEYGGGSRGILQQRSA